LKRTGYALAGAAFVVQAPRLVLTVLAADRLPVAAETERLLLTVAAVGTAVVLTGGGVFLAHAALTSSRWRLALGIAWALVLTASAGLVAPAIVGRLAGQELHEVLRTPGVGKAWAILASLAHELTAAGCMLGAAAVSSKRSNEEDELRLWSERDGAVERAERAERELSELQARLGRSASLLPAQGEPILCAGCGRSFGSLQARSGHQRSCPARSAESSRAAEPLDQA
jgi:hypothetical protein